MKNFIVYESGTGEIVRTGSCPDDVFEDQAEESGELVMEGTANDATQKVEEDSAGPYIVDKTPAELLALPPYSMSFPDSVAYEGGSSWTDGEDAYDGDGVTYADEVLHDGKWIEFTWNTPVLTDSWQIAVSMAEGVPEDFTAIHVELFYGGVWHSSYQADIAQFTWIVYATNTNFEISKARITCVLGGTTLRIHEFGLVSRAPIYSFVNMRAGATRLAAGALLNEPWITVGHATLPDGVVMCEQ